MSDFAASLTRRSALITAAAFLLHVRPADSAEEQLVTVHKDPSCGCCSGWVQHLHKAGFTTNVVETADIDAVKTRLGVPGMEGGEPERYEVVLFGPSERRVYMRLVGEQQV